MVEKMIIRKIEICPKCGQSMPWKKRRTMSVRGERRIYVKCSRCGAKDVIVYRP